jgi:pimeloyl-ACP methyl ester carboxylesterase
VRGVRGIVGVAALVAGLAIAPVATATSAQAAGASSCAPNIGTAQPVVLVHGLAGHPTDWNSMVAALKTAIPNLYPHEFDYSKYNQEWVSNPNIGPKLATLIVCMATASQQAGGPGKVILVDHSMGGLATRYAATETPAASQVVSDIGLVVTIGTPNSGSALANGFSGVLRDLGCDIPDAIGDVSENNVCALSAINALRDNSAQLAKLPMLPSSIPLRAIAGDVTVTFPLFFTSLAEDTQGDLIVSEKSALQGMQDPAAGGGQDTVACSISIDRMNPGWLALDKVTGSPILPTCWHSALPHNTTVEQDTIGAIKQYLASVALSAVIQPYVGTWFSADTGLTMVMNADGTATLSWNDASADMQCQAAGSGLDCTLSDVDAPNTGFQNGGSVSLSMASDGGVDFNPYSAADGTELYKAGSITPYVGFWYVNSGGLTIKADGSGTLQYDADSCPVTAAGACTIYEDVTLNPNPTDPGTATVTVDSSYVIALQATGNTVQSNSVIPAGTTYQVTQLGGGELQIDMTSSPYPIFSGQVPLCLYGSPAQTQDVCGA